MTTRGSREPVCDIKFTIGYLDSLGVGGLLIQADGQISGYNATMLKLIGREDIEGTYTDFAHLLAEHNDPTVEIRIENHFRSVGEEDCFDDLHQDVKLPEGRAARMVAVRFAFEADDLSAAIALIPQSAVPLPVSSPGVMDNQRWLSVISSFGAELKEVNSIAEKLTNRFYNEMSKEGNGLLEKLDGSAHSLGNMLEELAVMLRIMNEKGHSEVIDLRLLVHNAIRQVVSDRPAATVECRCENLPKITANPKISAKILRNTILCMVRLSQSAGYSVVVCSELEDDSCRIIVSSDGLDIPQRNLKKLLEFFGRVPGGCDLPVSGDGTSLAVTRQLAFSLGWQFDLAAESGERSAIAISIPSAGQPTASSD